MNTTTDEQQPQLTDDALADLLRYRTPLHDRQFTDHIVKKLRRERLLRQLILLSFSLLAVVSLIGFFKLPMQFNFPSISHIDLAFSNSGISVVMLLSLLGLGAWLAAED
jgi:hypothetical protein